MLISIYNFCLFIIESEVRLGNSLLDRQVSDSCTRSGCKYGEGGLLQRMGNNEHSHSHAATTHEMRYQESYMDEMNQLGYDKQREYSGRPALYKEKSLSNLYGNLLVFLTTWFVFMCSDSLQKRLPRLHWSCGPCRGVVFVEM